MSGALDASDFVLAHNNASMRVRPAGARFAAKRPPRIRSELADPRARELALESVRARQLGLALRQRRQARRACRVWGVAEAAPPTPAAPAFLAARASRRCRRPTFNARIPGLSPASLTCSGATQARLSCRVLLAGFTPASKRPEMLARARSASTSGPDARPVGDDESDAAAHDDPVLRRARRSWFARRSRSRGRWRRALAGRRATGLQQAACRGRDERRRPPPALPNGREGPVRTRAHRTGAFAQKEAPVRTRRHASWDGGSGELAEALAGPVWGRYALFRGHPRITGWLQWDVREREVLLAGKRGDQALAEVLSAPRQLSRAPVTPVISSVPDDMSPGSSVLRAERERSGTAAGVLHAPRSCARCGGPLAVGLRSEARYCSKRCRQASSRERLKDRPSSPPSVVLGECVWCGGPMPEGLRAEARFCSKRCRQASSRQALRARRSSAGSGPDEAPAAAATAIAKAKARSRND